MLEQVSQYTHHLHLLDLHGLSPARYIAWQWEQNYHHAHASKGTAILNVKIGS